MNMLTPLTSESFKKMQLNAGLFLTGFDYSSYDDADALRTAVKAAITSGTGVLGATRGGGTFVVSSETRAIEADGKRYGFKGDQVVDSVDAKLTGTLLEVTPENMALIMATGEVAKSGKKTTVTMHTMIGATDYIDKLCWIGDLADGGLVLIGLDNALNSNGLTLTFTDKGEGTIPFEFHAHQDDVNDFDKAPFEIVFFDQAA